MFQARLLLLVFVLVQVGCAPARHAVRVQTADGQVRTTTPPPRPPMALPKEEVRQAVRTLAQTVVPVADPVEFARERFEVPIREGVYVLNARTKELKPADKATEAAEEPSPEALAQARDYLKWCQDHHQPFDCFGGLHGRRTLDAYGRYTVTMGVAIASTFEKTKESLGDMVNVKEVLGMVVAGVTMYAVLWVLPEPTSKGIAAAMTIVLVGWVGVDTLYTLGTGWKELIDKADTATTFEELKVEGERFAGVMGADNARILVMVATAAVGSGVGQLAKLLPTLPGAGAASELAVAEGGVPFEQLGAVESVTIGERGLTISLTTGAVLATSLGGNSGGGPRINLIRPTPDPEADAIAERIRALKKAGVRGNLDQLKERIAVNEDGALGELEAVERWLRQGIKGEEIEVLEASTVQGQKTPDFRVKGELVEIKTRGTALSKNYIREQVGVANTQVKLSGIDAGRPMVGVNRFGPQGQLEIQLKGAAARSAVVDVLEPQVRSRFSPDFGTSLRRVAIYGDDVLIAEWIRTANNAIVRTFPLP